jgi:hypothetical protein
MNIIIGPKLCTKAKLYCPWSARWVLEVHLDGAPPSGKVTVQWGNTKLVGTVVPNNTGQSVGAGAAIIVGGIGWQNIPPSSWLVDTMAKPATVAQQLAQAIGETLTIGANSCREGRVAYARAMQPASMTLENLLAENALWWVGLDGATNTGTDRPSSICSAEVLHVEPHTRRIKLDAEEPSKAQPGMIIKARDERLLVDQRIREVWFEADEHGVQCWAECDGAGPLARLPELLASIVSEQAAYSHFRGATVQSQDRFGKVSLRLEERDRELSDSLPVSVWCGVPGVSAEVFSGTRMMLAFDRGDPSNPFAALFSPLGQTGHVPNKVRHEANNEIRFFKESAGVGKFGVTTAPLVHASEVTRLVTTLQNLGASLSLSPVPEVAAVGAAITAAFLAYAVAGTTKLEAQ